ncbi:MAG: guanylate kinase [Bacteroidia bacterium]|nr:guanylate kinase [Bacteroidia bacterium]MDW8014933.1 guanylate kinase [Bacteroidia bacterium]
MKALLLTGPSGAGKSTIAQLLLQRQKELAFSLSATTRPPRPGEVHGRDYYFLTEEEFDAEIKHQGFIEWERLFSGYRYGTLWREIARLQSLGQIPLFIKDVKGALSLKQALGKELLTVIVVPPSLEALQARLLARGHLSKEDLEQRLKRAEDELKMAAHFDFILYNEDVMRAVERLERLLKQKLL